MAIKVVVKGQKPAGAAEQKSRIPAITAPKQKPQRDNIIIRVVKVMLMDIRIRLNPKLRQECRDYLRFCDLARGKP